MTSPVVVSSTPTSWDTAETAISVGVGSPQEGNRLLLGVITTDGVPSVAGWEEIVPDDTSNFFEYSLFHKIADAAEPDASLTLDTADVGVAFVVEVDTDALPVASNWDTQGAVTTINYNNPGTPTEDAIVLRFGYLDRDPRTVDSVAGHTLVGHVSTSQGSSAGSAMSVYEAPVASGVDAGAASGTINFSSRTGAVSVLLEEVPSASPPINHPIELQPEAGWNYTDGTSTTPADPTNAIPFPAIGDQIAFEDTAALEGSAPGARDGGSVSIAADGVVTITPTPTTAESFRYYLYDDSAETWGLVGTFTWDLGGVVHPAQPVDLDHGHTLDETTAARTTTASAEDLTHTHTLDQVAAVKTTAVGAEDVDHPHLLDEVSPTAAIAADPEDLTHGHTLDELAANKTTAAAAEDLAHGHTLDETTAARTINAAVEDLDHAHNLDVTSASTGTLADPVNLGHFHFLDEVTAVKQTTAAVDDLQNPHTLDDAPGAKQTSATVVSLLHAHTLTTAAVGRQLLEDRFPTMATDVQRLVVKHLGEVITLEDATEIRGIFENEWYDPALGPVGFEAGQAYVEFLDEDTGDLKLDRGYTIVRRRDGTTYRIKEVRKEEFAFTRYVLELVA